MAPITLSTICMCHTKYTDIWPHHFVYYLYVPYKCTQIYGPITLSTICMWHTNIHKYMAPSICLQSVCAIQIYSDIWPHHFVYHLYVPYKYTQIYGPITLSTICMCHTKYRHIYGPITLSTICMCHTNIHRYMAPSLCLLSVCAIQIYSDIWPHYNLLSVCAIQIYTNICPHHIDSE